jgi:hypothetical protein
MEFRTHVAGEFTSASLHGHVDVLVARVAHERPAVELGFNFIQC